MSPPISSLQAAWLTEIGVDPQWLGLLGAEAPSAPRPALGGQQTPPVERPPAPPADAGASLEALDEAILACQACGLHAGRTRAVPGAGRTQSPEYLIVGEMPGAADDAAGRPFEGPAGSLLRAMLAGARVPDADSAYLTNVLKCRPTGGRMAQVAEVAACLPHLRRQIELLRPRHILVLGRLAARALLETRAALEDLRGHEHAYTLSDGSTIPLWVTHHPASLLVRPVYKAQAWMDLLALARAARDPARRA
ncbi:uracil-DNA glycosylase [Castellaniella sp. GW247-6E4]|uniref:uracil-DNA glycosylase n=1 Tax=Castellaniella sp. GW247-6E4 TaxID=3140380 RepID=UPI0033164356